MVGARRCQPPLPKALWPPSTGPVRESWPRLDGGFHGSGVRLEGGQWFEESVGNQEYIYGLWGKGGQLWEVGHSGEIVYRP
jgi:hypothetical protein